MTTRSRPHRRLLLALACCLGLVLFASGVSAQEPASDADVAGDDAGLRFLRADLVDVATYVGERTGMGFVLGNPALRTLTLSLYLPTAGTPEQITAMFMTALEAHGIEALERDGYWLIGFADAAPQDATVTLDFRGASVEDVAAFMSGVVDQQFIVLSDAPRRPLTIQAQRAIGPDEALTLVLTALEAEGFVVERRDEATIILRGAAQPNTPRSHRDDPDTRNAPRATLADAD